MSFLEDLGEAISDGWDAATEAASELGEDIQDTWEDFTGDVEDTWDDAMDTAGNAFREGHYVQGVIAAFGGVAAGVLGTIGAVSDLGLNISGDVLLGTGSLGGILTATLARVGIIVITGGLGSGTARDVGRFISDASRTFVEWGAQLLDMSGDLLKRAIDISAGLLLTFTDTVRCLAGAIGKPAHAGYPAQGFRAINHFFVVMLENRSFDHMLGYLPGVDGYKPGQQNSYRWHDSPPEFTKCDAGKDARFSLQVDTPHEFPDVHEQLYWDPARPIHYEAGEEVASPASAMPPMTGFAMQYYRYIREKHFEAIHNRETPAEQDPQEAMNGFKPERVPVLSTLAQEFAVCDRWHSSLPGPTLPNRQFIHAATSGGMADSPSSEALIWAMTMGGFEYENGTLYDRLDANCIDWHVYAGDATPLVMTLKGMATDGAARAWDTRIGSMIEFLHDLNEADNDFPRYVFVEPHYGRFWSTFKGGNSQHPLDSTVGGEALVKLVYEALRQSKIWETSALIITYDEHGGFYDHVSPPAAVSPGDSREYESWSISNKAKAFQFDRLGVRVPAVIVSPWIAKGTIDNNVYDHSSLIATLGKRFNFRHLTQRDHNATTFDGLFTNTLRRDCITRLPDPVDEE